ncbi:MAG: hypothetical protein GF364_00890 [Candidatus Lokiarchaeota archaeon]|nr:hypothetical protein [Candidatus Lokiarchaeota archaeon]
MKVVIIGNSVGGQTVAESLLRNAEDPKDLEIVMISKEPYPYYSRIFLPHYIAEQREKDRLFVRKIDWYEKKGIHCLLGAEVSKIHPKEKSVELADSELTIKYDKLVVAIGSSPRKLDFGNPGLKGVFTLRTIADADDIKNYISKNKVKKAFIIGGGLLGIELGYHIKDLDIQVTICEIANYLLPRQLCAKSSQYLEDYLRNQGLEFVIGQTVDKLVGESSIEAVKLKSGELNETDIVMEQLGIIPNIELAKKSGIDTEKGICVNKFMQTNFPDIYAVGDCIQFNDKIWGIIPASMDQAKVAASHIIDGEVEPYKETIWQTKLKIAGLDLLSVGTPEPENDEVAEVLWKIDKDHYVCRKVIYQDDKLTGAILMGPGADTRFFIQNLGENVKLDELKEKIDN